MENIDLLSVLETKKNYSISIISTNETAKTTFITELTTLVLTEPLKQPALDEAQLLKTQWDSNPHNIPVTFLPYNQPLIDKQILISLHIKIRDKCLEKIAYLNTNIVSNLVTQDLSTNNDYYKKYEKTNDYLIQFKDCFLTKGYIDKYIIYNNELINIDKDVVFSTEISVDTWFSIVNTRITNLNTTFTKINEYFEALKKLILTFKITDDKVAGNDYLGQYSTRNTNDKAKIDELYDLSLGNKKDYEDRKKVMMEELKITDIVAGL